MQAAVQQAAACSRHRMERNGTAHLLRLALPTSEENIHPAEQERILPNLLLSGLKIKGLFGFQPQFAVTNVRHQPHV